MFCVLILNKLRYIKALGYYCFQTQMLHTKLYIRPAGHVWGSTPALISPQTDFMMSSYDQQPEKLGTRKPRVSKALLQGSPKESLSQRN